MGGFLWVFLGFSLRRRTEDLRFVRSGTKPEK
jgi:hypothetical protein